MSHRRHVAIVCFSVILSVLSALPASADVSLMRKDEGMESRLFRPTVDTKGHFTIDSTPILPHLAISLSLVLDFGFNNWVAVEQDGNEIYDKSLVDNYINSVLMFNLGLFDIFVVGVQLPLAITGGKGANFSDRAEDMAGGQQGSWKAEGWSTKGGIGDIAFHVKARFLRADRHPIGIGALAQIQAPVGKPEYLMGEPGGAVSGKLIFDAEPTSWYRIALNVGGRYSFSANSENRPNVKKFDMDSAHSNDCTQDNIETTQCDKENGSPDNDTLVGEDVVLFKYGPMVGAGLGQSFSFWPEVMDFVLEVYANQLTSEFGNMAYMSMEVNGGFKMYVERNSYLMAGYAHGIPLSGTDSGYGFQNMEHRLFLGFAFEPSMGDRDYDGLKDDLDSCPDEPEDRDDFEDADGCPDPDNDRDGILDVDDECPLVPEDRDGDRDQDGCPERGDNDRDGDGIPDEIDQCPDDPEDVDQFEDKDGCPDPDNDRDGILDVNDVCPMDPEDIDQFEDANGCPDPDNDADRILDVDDQCPNEPETYNGKDDQDGCPDQGDVVLTGTDIKILKKVYFEYDSAVIKPVSYEILDAVAATIISNSQIDEIEVQGHADERGDDKYNLRLTTDRAAAVKTYLVDKGVQSSKLRSMGYGEYCPVDLNHNDAAWEENRRVEFKVISVGGQLTGVETGCERAKQMGVYAQ